MAYKTMYRSRRNHIYGNGLQMAISIMYLNGFIRVIARTKIAKTPEKQKNAINKIGYDEGEKKMTRNEKWPL